MCNKMSMSDAGKLGAIAAKETKQKQLQERIETYFKNPKLCKQCNKALPYKEHTRKHFCDNSCAASFNNIKRKSSVVTEIVDNKEITLTSNKKVIKKRSLCIFCSKTCKRNADKYCSLECQAKQRWNIIKQKIDQEQGVYSKNPRQAKRYLLETHGHKCAIPNCGISEWHGKPVLLICDHINGNSGDWNLTNLRLICSNCDAQTPFYKARNKGNGRHSRRQRYKDGKSY